MKQWNLVIDVALCQNCNNCVLASKDELVGNRFPGYTEPHPPQGAGVFRIERKIRGTGHLVDAAHVPMMCNHCDDAPCIKAGRGAVKKRSDGIVIIDPVQAKGRRDLVDACPYDAILWNETEQLPQTWFFDAHLLDQGWNAPRCVSVCPTRAITAMQLTEEQLTEHVNDNDLRPLKPELGTRPRVYYRNLHRFDRLFVAGSVVRKLDHGLECVADAEVELSVAGKVLQQMSTDSFGDFKFDDLAAAIGPVRITVRHATFGSSTCDTQLDTESITLGEIVLAA